MKQLFLLTLLVLAAPSFADVNLDGAKECASKAMKEGPFDFTRLEDWANIATLCYQALDNEPVTCALDGIKRINLGDVSDWADIAKLCSGADGIEPVDCAVKMIRGRDLADGVTWGEILKHCAPRD